MVPSALICKPVQMVKFGCELHPWYGRDDGLAGLVVVSLRRTSRKRNGDESGADEPHDWGRSRTTTIGHLGVSSCIRRDGNISGRLVPYSTKMHSRMRVLAGCEFTPCNGLVQGKCSPSKPLI